MADIFYGIDKGDQEFDAVTDSSSPTKDVEIVVDDAVGLTKGDVIIMLRQLINHILKEPDY